MLAPIAFSSAGQIATAPRHSPAACSSTASPSAAHDQDVGTLEMPRVYAAAAAEFEYDYEPTPQYPPVLTDSVAREGSGKTGHPQSAVSETGSAVALVAMFAYSGSIISSPLVGSIISIIIADGTGSLRYAILFLALVLLLIFPISFHIPPDPDPVNS
jgi:hypothetical protein